MAGYTNKLKLTLWVSVVYVLSFLCYVPTLLEQNGMIIPNGLLYLKYLYVCIPTIAAIFLLIYEQNIKVFFTRMFSGKITIKYILTGVICMAAGIFESYCYSFIVKTDVFKNIYCGSSEIHWAWNKLMVLMGIGHIILAGIMGIKWGLLYRMTGNIWVGLGDHLFNNTVATNMLHVVWLKGADELQIVRIMAAQIISFAFVMVVYCCRNRKGNG